jgi:cold shock protein
VGSSNDVVLPYCICFANALGRIKRLARAGVVMPTGTVKWFNEEKGFGFIMQQGGEDVFVHRTQIEGKECHRVLYCGDQVQFETERGKKGLTAQQVRVLTREV